MVILRNSAVKYLVIKQKVLTYKIHRIEWKTVNCNYPSSIAEFIKKYDLGCPDDGGNG